MGNATAVPHRPRRLHSGKVILSDGSVHEYHEPLTVAELMLEYPQHMVIEFPPNMSTTIDRRRKDGVQPPPPKRPSPLPADKKLEMNKVYFMVPVKRSGANNKPTPALSADDARRILMKAETLIMSSPSLGCSFEGILPLLVRMVSGGAVGGGGGGNKTGSAGKGGRFGEMLGAEDEKPAVAGVAPEFVMMSRSVSGKGWKPSLDTITEKTVQAKVRHWLF
ncbi:OLC1v1004414C1 [Oldenlandia corymbosa var. corymbosa]|uniref:OLC1v1004414C1 n=1 Tax=Oldenlandia corymbosa var. corymbosa TaxID=529605 RepID=A0AAV1DC87_OLDCO|nr:OLC1v1004414C1 [Oldenlandia corymbosa var. corymbosa]